MDGWGYGWVKVGGSKRTRPANFRPTLRKLLSHANASIHATMPSGTCDQPMGRLGSWHSHMTFLLLLFLFVLLGNVQKCISLAIYMSPQISQVLLKLPS